MTTELTNETKKDEDLLGGDKGILSDQSFIPGTGGLISTNIPKAGDFLDYTVGALTNARLKTYFNIQLLFILWTGDTDGALTTTHDNWIRTSSEVIVTPGGSMAQFSGTLAEAIYLNPLFRTASGTDLNWNAANMVIMDWWAKLSATNTGDVNMGFGSEALSFQGVWNDISGNGRKVAFSQKSTGELIAVIGGETIGAVTTQDISSGLTLTNWNNYRIELDLSNNAKFYVNGILKATLSGANLPVDTGVVLFGFGRSNTADFVVTAPVASLEMNP